MKQADFEVIVNETVEEIKRLLIVKGGEYAGSEDRLSNFKRGAELTGTSPLQVAFIYASKHYDAIATFVRDSSAGVRRERSEPIAGRLDDLINYCMLIKALVKEEEQETESKDLRKQLDETVFYGNKDLDRDSLTHGVTLKE